MELENLYEPTDHLHQPRRNAADLIRARSFFSASFSISTYGYAVDYISMIDDDEQAMRAGEAAGDIVGGSMLVA